MLNSEKHKVLICTSFYHPEKGAAPHRITSMAETLDGDITVITPLANYPTGKIFSGQFRRVFFREYINGVTIIRYCMMPSNSNSVILRILSMIITSLAVFFTTFRHLLFNHNYDKVIIQTPPLTSAFAYALAARIFSLRIILNVSDIWPSTATDLGAMRKGSISWKVFRFIELHLYRNSSSYIAQSEETLGYLNGIHNKPLLLFRNLTKVINTSFIKKKGNTKIIYAGLLGIAQDVLKIISQVDFETLGVELHIYGYGNQKDEISKLKKPGVFYHKPVSKEEIQSLMISFDFSLVPLRTYIFGAFPSKINAAVASTIPVLFLGKGEGVKIVNKFGIGKAFDFEDKIAISNYLESYKTNRDAYSYKFYQNLIEAQNDSFNLDKNNTKLNEFIRNQ